MKKQLYFLLILPVILVVTGCSHTEKTPTKYVPPPQEQTPKANATVPEVKFSGIKGEAVSFMGNKVEIDEKTIENGIAKYFNVEMSDGKVVYFFIVKDSGGIYRAAANACEVCHNAKMGFRQEGNNMICNTCGNKYPMEKIATEKGGCNPGPINKNLTVKNNKIIIEQSDIAQVVDLF